VTQVPNSQPITTHYLAAGVGADVIDPDAKLSYTDEVVGGVEFEVMPHTTFGARYVYRNIGRVLEDVANCPVVAYEFSAATSAACGSVEYILNNPSTDCRLGRLADRSKFPMRTITGFVPPTVEIQRRLR
jgi:hypothetical protein